MDIFRNGIKKDAKAAMQRLSRMPEAVIEGVRSELDLVLGFDGAQEDEVEPDEVEPEDVALAIENYLKKYYSVVLEELISMFRNEADEDDEEAMERWSKVPKAVRLGIRAELDLVLGFDSTQLDEVDRGDMARAIENYLKKHYSHSS
jgi:hypothetical protein